MIRNVLYSLFFHLIIILLVYINVNFRKIPESENNPSVTVSFIVTNGNSEKITNQVLKTTKAPDPVAPEVKEVKKPAPPKQKDNQKKVKKISKSKPNLSDIKVKNTEVPKEIPQEVIKKAPERAPIPEKKEPIKL